MNHSTNGVWVFPGATGVLQLENVAPSYIVAIPGEAEGLVIYWRYYATTRTLSLSATNQTKERVLFKPLVKDDQPSV